MKKDQKTQRNAPVDVVVKMVEEFIKKGRKYFACSICGMTYKKTRQAIYCEMRCKEGKECQRKMIIHSVHF